MCFAEFIEVVGLTNIPIAGGKYTWCSNREEPSFSRPDRFLLGAGILEKFSNIVQKLWPRFISDHFSVFVSEESVNCGPKPFEFFNYWLEDANYHKVVRKA